METSALAGMMLDAMPRAQRFCRKLCRDKPQLFEDLVQDVWMQALGSAHQFTYGGEAGLVQWLNKIAFSCVTEAGRRARSHIDRPLFEDETRGRGPSAEASVLLRELSSRVTGPAGGLSLAIQRALEGITYPELAQRYVLPVGTVGRRVFKARERLREEYAL